MLEGEHIEALTKLGITLVQSKVFFAIARFGCSTIHEISESSKVPRQDIYRIVSELQEMSLVEREVASPAKFRAVGMEEASTILLERKKQEYDKLKRLREDFLQNLNASGQSNSIQKDNENQILVVKGREALLNRTVESLKNSKSCVRIATTQNRYLQAMSYLEEIYKKKFHEGLICRVVMEKPVDETAFLASVGAISESPNLEFRYVRKPLKANVSIFDSATALAAMNVGTAWLYSPVMYTNHPAFLAMFQDYFDGLWKTGGHARS